LRNATRITWVAALLLVAALIAAAQTFDAAIVKPTSPGAASVGAQFAFQPAAVVVTNATLYDMVSEAWNIRHAQIDGGPAWSQSARFDVTARAAAGAQPTASQLRLMLRELLQERFALRTRSETREQAIFELRADGPLGNQIRPSSIDCDTALDGRAHFDTAPASDPACTPRMKGMFSTMGSRFETYRPGTSMPRFAAWLTRFAERAIVDRTGLTGRFDIELTFSPEGMTVITTNGIQQAPPADGLSIQTSVREQLGLRLVPARGPVDVLVLENAERPTAD
jgi:uncharacterized protein (TIGR03435 family)